MAPSHPILQSISDWADAVARLQASGRLPVRTVIVPTERHAHGLRRALVTSGRASALAGTRFVGHLTLAHEVLAAGGLRRRPGEEGLRAARLLSIFAASPLLERFDLGLLRDTPGWPEAFAAAISDLEGTGLSPGRLPSSSAQWRDVAALWRLVDEAAGESITAARAFGEATALLERGTRTAIPWGPTLAAVTGREPAVQLRFLRAIPNVTVALFAIRPVRNRPLDRVGALLGPAARDALAGAPAPREQATERDLLARYLFAPPEVLSDPARKRSRGPDGTVELSEHAGVEAEIEAAAEWVAREVLTARTPLADVAILLPTMDPFAAMVASRLARLPWANGPFPVHVAGGLPLSGTAGGARALGLLRSLASFLPAESVATLLPSLRIPIDDRQHLTHAEAATLAWSLGTVGGNAAHREGALEWAPGAAAREAQLARAVAALDEEPVAEEREGYRLRPVLELVRAARPALEALVELARRVVADEQLSTLGPAIVAFLEEWMLDPGPGAPVHALLAGALADLSSVRPSTGSGRTDPRPVRAGPGLERPGAGSLGSSLKGASAIDLVEDRLLSLRIPTCRFGEPAVYVGTLAGAVELEFQAVRILGLAEGSLPSPVREDPVLPDSMRREAEPLLVPLAEDRALGQLQAFDQAVRGARRAIALSVPHSDLERSEREASSLLLDAGAALGRPDPEALGPIPSLASLTRTSFAPARVEAASFRGAHTLSAPQWQDRAVRACEIHPSWVGEIHLDLARILSLSTSGGLGPAYGVLGDQGPFPPMPGLDPDRPISASALEKLVSCPLGFLFQRILHFDDPGGAPSVRELDALSYGGLFHEVAEAFYRAHGEAFVARKRTLPQWKAIARELADERLVSLLVAYPLVGTASREKERKRLLRDLESFLEYDWRLPLTRFVGVELPFGYDEPVVLKVGGVPLHVRGYVDRIDIEGDHALLRDLKTGNDHPRTGDEANPTPSRDVQLGLYGLVARKLSARWGIPKELQAAYAYPRNGEERAFRGDHADLDRATKSWLEVAASLMSERSFPPTPMTDRCTYCAYGPVCGDTAPARAAAALEDADGAVAEFLELHAGEE
jgi:RecB family exonuclease